MVIKLFATLKETAGSGSIEIEIDNPLTVTMLIEKIGRQFPSLKPNLSVSIVAINRHFADLDTMVYTTDEVAFFPPVSGG